MFIHLKLIVNIVQTQKPFVRMPKSRIKQINNPLYKKKPAD